MEIFQFLSRATEEEGAVPTPPANGFYTTEDGAKFYVFDGTTDKVIVEP